MKQDFYRSLFPKEGLTTRIRIEMGFYIVLFAFAVGTVRERLCFELRLLEMSSLACRLGLMFSYVQFPKLASECTGAKKN